MNPRRLGQPAIEPVTVADAIAHCRAIDGDVEQAQFAGWIKTARLEAEEHTRRTFISCPLRAAFDWFAASLLLRRGPVIDVTAIQYRDLDGALQPVQASAWLLDDFSDPPRVVLARGAAWPQAAPIPNAVLIDYTAGYGPAAADVPEPIRQWMLLRVGMFYEHRDLLSPADIVISPSLDGLLDYYRLPEM